MTGSRTSPHGDAGGPRHARLLVLGANGPTGRRVVQQALDRGHRVSALTRHPESFPIRHDRLHVLAGDATDERVIDAAVAGADAVVCAIGASFTRRPVQVYSASARLLVEAMTRHQRRRLVVVTSSGLGPPDPDAGVVGRAFRLLMRQYVGRTVYDDMAGMEVLVSASDLDWTIVRPPGLTDAPGTGYAVADTEIDAAFCAREDLAGMLLDQLDDDRFVRGIAAVATPGLRVGAGYMLWHEVLKR
ncbi:NAD(P)-dependent oxidoreductase [Modestobacter roseus]|uniref:Putative NADH-flavin reductase n=1 Tax=Modestobacter roseus TaxID=1181884 RepID=A0A562INI3_9ACTN|nr:NAD(P)H-binding protein [Modestobacter roseus]MQA35358.1 NAD(P)H-binding protein [Modestobacter roseus]TWH72577.1 putative NADH-flavin reductase [Modestobacter roseus]